MSRVVLGAGRRQFNYTSVVPHLPGYIDYRSAETRFVGTEQPPLSQTRATISRRQSKDIHLSFVTVSSNSQEVPDFLVDPVVEPGVYADMDRQHPASQIAVYRPGSRLVLG